jgi:two-component system, response regulator YesN
MYQVLIVDDEALQREYLLKQIPVLDPRFSIIGEASDGLEALLFLEQHTVDILITDIKMPLMSGLELCHEVYIRYPQMKIVILSGYEEFEYAKQALNYKAEAYLLKPLNRAATREMLNRIADMLTKKKADEITLQGLLVLSEEAKQLVARRLLQALLSASQAEINTLFPLIHRLKIHLFEGEGLILLLALDEYPLFLKQVPAKDISIFHYILNQIAAEIAAAYELTWTLFDEGERTVILLSGTETSQLADSAQKLFTQINEAMKSTTQLSLTGGLGLMIEDILQVDISYQTALEATHRRFVQGGNCLYAAEAKEEFPDTRLKAKWEAVFSIMNEPDPSKALKITQELVDALRWPDNIPLPYVYSFGSFLLTEVIRRYRRWQPNQLEQAWLMLAGLELSNHKPLTKDLVAQLYQTMLASFDASINSVQPPSIEWSEQSLMEQIRHFIDLHYAEPISLALIADKFDLSQQYISTAFHKYAGVPYIKYMTNVRMKMATRLLEQKPIGKIYEIAEQVGYVNVKHFSYVFRKHYGMTPGEYQMK